MAWMPVAEAAASLGVSERTIWRRIKAETIPSRSDHGRTLVALDDPDPDADPVRQMSHVAAAQLSMRKLDADTVSEVLTVVSDYRISFDQEIRRCRRSLRLTGALAVMLLLALGAGAWYHMDQFLKLERNHQANLGSLRQEFESDIVAYRESAAKAEGLAGAQAGEIETLRKSEESHRELAAGAVSMQKQVQASVDKQLTGLQTVLVDQQRQSGRRDWEVERLTKTITDLRTELAKEAQVQYAVRRQLERAIDAARRSAARNAGAAEGMRLYVDSQHAELVRLRNELSVTPLRMEHEETPTPSSPSSQSREAIWQSVIGDPSAATDTAEPTWLHMLKSSLSVWIGSAADSDSQSELAQAN